ncbi:ABC transporter ATP-binding protein/permease [Paenibacillus sp. TRM 82003]|uniref:ABC transporter transmembrane domain-containing protein n=1 Tax=Kineococcus sp. TRM81007 TaxID=2925831 RepID=UPI001F583CAF|nr:ABC transporter ATP-binding protein [Kineococcus sp. TRM81007]MCI2239028.1 ABC transporter ATP-binding protein/permease [Kineococcus sp. TRM81007]MCI3924448.1 ABC transporter ATP-binding protein/permease [Paenibacillus sp. TRM 82003]
MTPSRRLLADVLRRRRRPALVGCLASTVHQTCEALVPVAIGLVVARAVATGDTTAIAWSVAGVLALFAVLTAAGAYAFWTIEGAQLREAHHLRVVVLRAVLHRPPTSADLRDGDVLSVATSDTRHTAEVLALLGYLFSASVGMAVSAVVLLRVDALLGLGLLVAVPLLVLGLQRLAPRLERRVRTRQEAAGLAAATAADLLAGLRPLRGFGGVPEAVRRYRTVSRTSRDAAVGAAGATAAVVGAGTLATGLLLLGTAAAATALAVRGRIDVGELVTVVGAAAFLADPVRTITSCVQGLAVSRASAARVAALLADGPGDVPGPRSAATGAGEAAAAPGEPAPLVLEGVSAGPLRGLDLTAAPGEVLGVVTTDTALADALTGVLGGRRTPEAGTVRLGGLDPARDPVATGRLLVEPHAVHLLGGTLREALSTGTPGGAGGPGGRGPALLERALTASAADEVVRARPGGLDAELLERGANLSGGQQQRLALARALAADRPVLVLRDPTTALDALTEDTVAAGLRDLRHGPGAPGGRTTVVLTTSPLLLARCDRVVLLTADDPRTGTRTLSGTHAELLAEPAYAAAVLR